MQNSRIGRLHVDGGMSDIVSVYQLGVAVDPESDECGSSHTLGGSGLVCLVLVCWGFI